MKKFLLILFVLSLLSSNSYAGGWHPFSHVGENAGANAANVVSEAIHYLTDAAKEPSAASTNALGVSTASSPIPSSSSLPIPSSISSVPSSIPSPTSSMLPIPSTIFQSLGSIH